ncbi:7-carboxy-7-deazaguanine synthase [soil metagenome]
MYTVKAIWKTLQGEGAWAGRPAVFVRMVACNMWSGYEKDRTRDAARMGADCPMWCDTDFTREGATRYDAEGLADAIAVTGGDVRFVVLTGGEPLLQADAALVRALHARDFEVAVETNGTVSIGEAFGDTPPDWVVCSPKLPPEKLKIEWMDELKLVVPDYHPGVYAQLIPRVREHAVGSRKRRYLWLQPEDGPRYELARAVAIGGALADPRWRVSVQTHKILEVE